MCHEAFTNIHETDLEQHFVDHKKSYPMCCLTIRSAHLNHNAIHLWCLTLIRLTEKALDTLKSYS